MIGFFVVIACAATLHASGRSIDDARDAAIALEPLAGAWSARLFGAGLLGAALLAVAIVPLSTAYSVAETFGTECRLDDRLGEARIFYGTYLGTMAIAATIVLIPAVPLVPVLFLSQALNAILLVPLLVRAQPALERSRADGRARQRAAGVRLSPGWRPRAHRLRPRARRSSP